MADELIEASRQSLLDIVEARLKKQGKVRERGPGMLDVVAALEQDSRVSCGSNSADGMAPLAGMRHACRGLDVRLTRRCSQTSALQTAQGLISRLVYVAKLTGRESSCAGVEGAALPTPHGCALQQQNVEV